MSHPLDMWQVVSSTQLCSPGFSCRGCLILGLESRAWKYPLSVVLKAENRNIRKPFHYLAQGYTLGLAERR